jgi:hypothetical protein
MLDYTKRKNEITTANVGLAIWRLNCFYETFVQGSTLGILINFSAKIRHIVKLKNASAHIQHSFSTYFRILIGGEEPFAGRESFPSNILDHSQIVKASGQAFWTVHRL